MDQHHIFVPAHRQIQCHGEIIVQNSLNTETYKLILNNVDVLPSSGGGSSSVSHAIDSSEDTEHSTKLDGSQQF